MKRLFIPLCLALASLWPAASAQQPSHTVEARLSSRFLTRSEQATLEIVVQGGEEPDRMPAVPSIPGLTIRSLGATAQTRFSQDRRRQLDYVFRFMISGYDVGHYEIPPIDVTFGGEKVSTAPVGFEIFDEMTLQWLNVTVGKNTLRYAAAFHALKTSPYVGEKVPVEIKLYFPADQRVEEWGIPDFERDGLSAWRFTPQPAVGRAALLGHSYTAVSYPSTLSANRVGKVKIGPAKLSLQTIQFVPEEFGRAFYEPANIEIPALEIDSRPLPAGAPQGFENAIGKFDLNVAVAETEVREGDPISVNLLVTGSGNLDTLQAPKPIDTDGWKLYDATPMERGEERRELSGIAGFRQFMRPLRPQSSVPPFQLVYFDPDKGTYETLLSEAISLTVLPSTAAVGGGAGLGGPPQALAVPIEEMTDILGFIHNPAGLLPIGLRLPGWSWQVIPAALALALLARIAALRLRPKFRKDPDALARSADLREVESAPQDLAAFYRAAGHFVERWLGTRQDPKVAEILTKRDEVAFRPETAAAPIDRGERNQVLRTLRRLALPLILLAFTTLFAPSARAQETAAKAFQDGHYEDAAKLWLESGPYERLSADTLFNIGDAAYRLGSPGDAALYYRRALDRQPTHPEARQNLRFLERKFGSIAIQRPDYQYALAALPLTFWKGLIWGGGWLVLLGVLTFAATYRGSGLRIAAVTAFVIAPLLTTSGIVAWCYYPDDARFAPPADQVVVVADQAVVRTDAARNAPRVIDAPAGSLARLLSRSGDWAYVAFTNQSRGWIPASQIEALRPASPPLPPKVRPRKSAEGNA